MSEAWVTLATNDTYCIGSLVLANSVKRVSTRAKLAILITPDVSDTMRSRLQQVFDCVQIVDVLDSKDSAHLALLARPELGITFTKIHAWKLTQYQKAVFLDADTLVVQNCDELFDREELSAVPDPGWPDCFNSGVFVFKPSEETYKNLIEFAATRGSFDGGDQGLLNSYFSDWQTSDIGRHLSFIYNMASSASYFYLPAYKQFGNNVKIVHFIGCPKPWHQNFATEGHHRSEHLQLWWTLFFRYVKPNLSADMKGLAGAVSELPTPPELEVQIKAEEEQTQQASSSAGQAAEQVATSLESRFSFDTVLARINDTLSKLGRKESSPGVSQRDTYPKPE